ncbi:MAG TPA: hypothetical protein VEC13_02205 [Candidatus Paceibacterota bacterium]|nr:hypothetical protein [Candidatus Paceibacterota bacterium]
MSNPENFGEDFSADVEAVDGMRTWANNLDLIGATNHPDPAVAELAQLFQKRLRQKADQVDADLSRELDRQADEGEKLL